MRTNSIILSVIITLIWSLTPALQSQTAESSAAVAAVKPSLNAVDYYQKTYAILETLDASDARRYRTKTLDQEAPRLLRQLEEAINLARTGAAIRTAEWPSRENNPGQSILLGKIVRSCSTLLVYTALHELEQGETEQAISDLLSSLAVARHASVKPNMMVKLIEIGASRRASDILAQHMPSFSKERVAALREQLKQLLPSPSLAEVIRKEYQFGILEATRQDKQTGRKDHFSERQFSELKNFYAALADAASLPPDKFATAINDQTSKYSENVFASLIGKILQSFQKNGSVSLTRRALLEGGIQIVLKGESAVSDSKDPYGVGPFTYQKHKNGFELSSQLIHRDKPVSMTFGPPTNNP